MHEKNTATGQGNKEIKIGKLPLILLGHNKLLKRKQKNGCKKRAKI